MTNPAGPNNVYAVSNGTTSTNPFIDIFEDRDPTDYDFNYPQQKKWLNTTTNEYWILKNFIPSASSVLANWEKIGSGSLTESLTGNSGGPVFPDGNSNTNILGDTTSINIVGNPGTSTLTVSAIGPTNIIWSSITANQTLQTNHGYFVTAGTLSLLLPATAAVGDNIYIALNGGTSFAITQAALQAVIFGNVTTTIGAGGSITTSAAGDAIRIICSTANTRWQVFSSIGNLTVV